MVETYSNLVVYTGSLYWWCVQTLVVYSGGSLTRRSFQNYDMECVYLFIIIFEMFGYEMYLLQLRNIYECNNLRCNIFIFVPLLLNLVYPWHFSYRKFLLFCGAFHPSILLEGNRSTEPHSVSCLCGAHSSYITSGYIMVCLYILLVILTWNYL